METFFKKGVMNILHKYGPSTVRLILVICLFCSPSNIAHGGDLQYQELPPGEGRKQVLENCTACHSTAIILQNRMPRMQWDQTLTWMQEKQGLWDLGPDLRKTILDYLSTHRGVKKLPSHNPLGHQYSYRPNPL
ncbi:MAG: hypothetical protein H8E42_00755 [Nitrospinae bacterium]|nr:hypothetical protein [Nitrospinota bacterium]MBL7021215.1 hypothetical protein [Nitrospinaceae bacterium]